MGINKQSSKVPHKNVVKRFKLSVEALYKSLHYIIYYYYYYKMARTIWHKPNSKYSLSEFQLKASYYLMKVFDVSLQFQAILKIV